MIHRPIGHALDVIIAVVVMLATAHVLAGKSRFSWADVVLLASIAGLFLLVGVSLSRR